MLICKELEKSTLMRVFLRNDAWQPSPVKRFEPITSIVSFVVLIPTDDTPITTVDGIQRY